MSVPYVVGQWVRGERFYGRGPEVAAALGATGGLLVEGMRRTGKTSLLRRVEEAAAGAPGARLLPLYWDLEGVDGGGAVMESLEDAVIDAGGRFAGTAHGTGDDAASVLARLAEDVAEGGGTLLVLADEAEELVALAAGGDAPASALCRTFAGCRAIRAVLAASPRCAALGRASAAGTELLGALDRLPLGSLAGDDARALLQQSHLPAAARPALSPEAVEAAAERCGGHAFLLQLLGRRTLDAGGDADAEAAAATALAADPVLEHLFAADMALLEDGDRGALLALAAGTQPDEPRAVRLAALGLLRRERGRCVPGNWFLNRYLSSARR